MFELDDKSSIEIRQINGLFSHENPIPRRSSVSTTLKLCGMVVCQEIQSSPFIARRQSRRKKGYDMFLQSNYILYVWKGRLQFHRSSSLLNVNKNSERYFSMSLYCFSVALKIHILQRIASKLEQQFAQKIFLPLFPQPRWQQDQRALLKARLWPRSPQEDWMNFGSEFNDRQCASIGLKQ